MNQIVKDKMQRQIMVVKNSILFKNTKRIDGFLSVSENFEEIILKNYEYMVRGQAEVNTDYKQPIPYGVVINDENKVFVYKRGGISSNAGESRLHSKISFGVGGHIEVDDKVSKNLLRETLLREVEEEINISENDINKVEVLGYINDDNSDSYSTYHLGVAYLIYVKNSNIALLDGELEKGEFLSLKEIEEMMNSGEYDIETWSKIIYDEIKKYLS
ncbi:MAG: NUDIX domain-containing protein [Candidatus Gracilibacteria bacterium]|nr:NUDIX domain-containing protein [Candidatus Gracilibacteria bacterium]